MVKQQVESQIKGTLLIPPLHLPYLPHSLFSPSRFSSPRPLAHVGVDRPGRLRVVARRAHRAHGRGKDRIQGARGVGARRVRRLQQCRAQGRLPAGKGRTRTHHAPWPCPRPRPFPILSPFQEERAIEHQIDHTVHTFSASVDVSYNVHHLPSVEPLSCTIPLTLTFPFARGSSSRTRHARSWLKADAW